MQLKYAYNHLLCYYTHICKTTDKVHGCRYVCICLQYKQIHVHMNSAAFVFNFGGMCA